MIKYCIIILKLYIWLVMNNGFALNIGLGVSQKLTPQMQQAIRLLQMSSIELEQEVQAKLDSNPMLERDEMPDEPDTVSDLSEHDLPRQSLESWNNFKDNSLSHEDGFDEYEEADSFDKLGEAGFDDDATDSRWQDVYGDDVEVDYKSAATEDMDFLGATNLCIQDHVRWQISFKKLSAVDNLIAEHLIDSMDDLGFIRTSVDEVYAHFAKVLGFFELEESIEPDEIATVLRIIQSCHPVGVGARDLPECLLLQLKYLPEDTEYMTEAKLVLQSAVHLQNNNIKALMEETALEMNDIKGAMALIRTLDPSPALSFVTQNGGASPADIPDVLVLAKDGNQQNTTISASTDSWQVMLNPQTLPRLKINQEYVALIKRGDDSADNVYLKENLADAKLFLRSIEERNQNLLKVAVCIAMRQQAFLLYGDKAMQPLTLKEVANDVDLHESTVSRLTSNKTMLTPQGLFPLKYFFSSHVSSSDGEVSSVAISALIEEMIANENPKKPLSDSELTRRLEAQGVEIARRTVAKYREAMGIASSSERKKTL